MIGSSKHIVVSCLLILCIGMVFGAYVKFHPVDLKQPDGSKLDLFASGDEYYNWLHDKDGYTVKQNDSGWYAYMDNDASGELVFTQYLAGKDDPTAAGLRPWAKISTEKIEAIRNAAQTKLREVGGGRAPSSGTLNNLAVFIRFSDQTEFGQNISTYNNMFNGTTGNTMQSYFLEASYNALDIPTSYYPTPTTMVVSWQDSHPRGYYSPYSSSNTIGYTTNYQKTDREFTLLVNAVNAISSQVPTGLNIDGDNDGKVDNVCFIIKGNTDGWSDLLWPHRWSIYDRYVFINGKRVYDFNFQLSAFLTSSGVGVLCHEMFHSLGAPDLYHYSYDGLTPVGPWDLMENDGNPPQHMCAYMKYKYGHWISSIPVLTADGTYTLNPLVNATDNCYKIPSPNSSSEYFVVEYRRKTGTFENSLPGSGMLIYRINPAYEGNSDGPPDEVYVYRPGGTTTADGSVNLANYSSETGRTALNSTTNPTPFLTNGSAGGININSIGSAGTTISFVLGNPITPPRNLAATSTHASVTLTWNAPEATTPNNYKVYRNSSYLATTTNLTYTDLSVTDGVTYSYYVIASYNNGNSVPSNTVTATPNTFPPTNLTAVGGDTVVNLSWTAAQGRGAEEEEFLDGRNISGYRIYRNGSSLTTVTGTSYSDHSVVNGTTYSYWVTTRYSNPAGESAASNTAEATPQAVSFAVIGSGTGTTPTTEGCPINIYKKSLHGQSVYTAAELNAAGLYGPTDITQLGFYVATAPALALPDFRMRMKHTTATDATNWISADGLTTVYSSASYQPVAGDWDMLTLSTPFAWNGIDNIVIDTDFDRVATESATGTVRYTNMSNGYRYGRSTYSNMGETFTGGMVSVYRPDVKLGFVYVEPAGPEIEVVPLSLSYGEVEAGQTSVKQFTIHNTGDLTLSGSITTPSGYTVSAAGNKGQKELGASRNTLSFSLPIGTQQTYNLSFNPTAAQSYPGNVVISSNDEDEPTVNIALTGSGYVPPTVSLDATALEATLAVNAQGTDSFNIANLGSQNLNFTLVEDPAVAWFSANPTSGTVAGNGSQPVTGSFTAAGLAPGTYTANLLVNTNDLDNPQLTVSLTLEVLNALPVIELPETLSFNMNSTLVEDFSGFVSDPDGHDLTLGYSGNTNILVSIEGYTVTFSAPPDWFGSEEITFSVFDGYGYAYDTVTVTVNLTSLAIPEIAISKSASGVTVSWEPVTNANRYHIYRATDPYGDYGTLPFATVLAPQTSWEDTEALPMAFYKVVAAYEELPAK